jgi:Zn-dependent protease with chaperone function
MEGVLFTGRDSRPRPVLLAAGAPGQLVATDLATGEATRHAMRDLTVSPRLGRAPRIVELPDGGRIECPDGPAFDAWFATPSRIEAAADWLERRKWIALGAAVLVALGSVGFVRYGLPATAKALAPRIPAAVESAMSRQALALMDRVELQPTRLPAARQAQLQAGFATLVRDLPRQRDMRLSFRRAKRIGANAFALPDGHLVMTDQLVALARSDAELLAVLAHEAGHHEHRHALRQTLESSGIVVLASLLFGDASGSSLTVSIPVVLLETGFSRNHEREADAFALDLLARRGLPPAAFGDMLERLERAHLGKAGADLEVGYLSTHPPTAARIRAAREFPAIRAPARVPAAP